MAVNEDGEWRIAEAPDALIVPETWFDDSASAQVSLYFFDPTARILVPEPVFVPRGEQLAISLIQALLPGPGAELAGSSRSFIPPGSTSASRCRSRPTASPTSRSRATPASRRRRRSS